jgi:CubicO group peptidase (beta-lactamase class C family)
VTTRSTAALAILAPALALALAACGPREYTAASIQTQLDTRLAANAAVYGVAGQAVVVVYNGETIYRGQHGLADRASQRPVRAGDVFPIHSVAKLFVSTLVFQLVEAGTVALEQPVGGYLPDLPAAWRAVTVGELLDHVSGLPDYFDSTDQTRPLPPTRDAAFAALATQPLAFAAGERTLYNQTNYLLLAMLLEAHHRMPYRQIVTERILAPLGLTDTYLGKAAAPAERLVTSYRGVDGALAPDLVIGWPDYAIAHTEVYATADVLARFLTAVAAGKLVGRETLLRVWKPHRNPDGSTGFAAGWDYGMAGAYQEVGHDGGAKLRGRIVFDPTLTESWVIVYLTNGSATNVWSRTLVESVEAIVLPPA